MHAGRRWFGIGLAVWLLSSLTVLGLVAGAAAPLLRAARNEVTAVGSRRSPPTVNTADDAAIAHTSGNPFGINTFLYQEVEEEKIRRSLAAIRDAGFGYIREQVAWQEFERGQKGGYWDERWQRPTWENLDRLVDLAREYGLEMIARVDYPPDWAQQPGTQWHASPPTRFEDYGDFVYTLAQRYKGRIKYYQVWNEPNLTIEWGLRPVDPAEYVRLLRVAYSRIKEADPAAVVIAAALAPTIEKGPQNLSDLEFLRRMYEAGARDYFDIASVNPYGLRSGPDDRSFAADDTNFSRPIQAREIMVQYGDAAKPIWASESGWCALPPDFPLLPVYGRTTRAQQAEYTGRAYERVLREWPWMGVVVLWHFRMVDNRLASQQAYYFGVLSDDFAPYEVYDRLGNLSAAPPVLYPGFRQEDSRAIVYAGTWATAADEHASLHSYMLGKGAGTTASARFWGSDLDLVARSGPSGGQLVVAIDGSSALANAVARTDEGLAVLDLKAAGETWQARLPLARGLSVGVHTVDIRLVSAEGTVSLDGFVVEAREPGSPISLLGGLALGLATFVVWAKRQPKR